VGGVLPVEYLGIDFSGNHASWRSRCTNSNVWICRVESEGNSVPQVTELQTVHRLSGQSPPFERLAELLAGKRFAAAMAFMRSKDSLLRLFPLLSFDRGNYRTRNMMVLREQKSVSK
jgi:hypothetical protein